ncbi:reverse transcriptase [Gossypium australe]|uniref:Reverse transcriptase n=1 Tax=Gossypium australe TaxID=47621 RepID=A0A5B6VNK1_9ROSI|nr:reverse transcriptase [Gossypium australe]
METNIDILPKVNNPTRMQQFRPISLCAVLYKLIPKVLVNLLASLCVDEAHSAFVLGRLITYNIIPSYEIVNSFHRKRRGKNGHFAFKLHMSKTYDRIE